MLHSKRGHTFRVEADSQIFWHLFFWKTFILKINDFLKLKYWSYINGFIPYALKPHKPSCFRCSASGLPFSGKQKSASKFSVKAATTPHGFLFKLGASPGQSVPALSLCVLKHTSIIIFSSVNVSTLFSSIVIWTQWRSSINLGQDLATWILH